MTDQEMEIWKAGYDIHDKFGTGPKSGQEWDALVKACQELHTRFGRSDFAFHMALMLVEYYDAVWKKRPAETCEQTKILECDPDGH